MSGVAKKILGCACLMALSACSTVESDPHTNVSVLQTRVDFQPMSRVELAQHVQNEEEFLAEKAAPLKQRLAEQARRRQAYYEKISKEFPECQRQKHCLSSTAFGDIKRFERFRFATSKLTEMDSEMVELEAELELWRRRAELRKRASYNRYLVYELLQVSYPHVKEILVYSLEAFQSRRAISLRLLQMADPKILPVYGDLNFKLLGRPVDEAAVVAIFQVQTGLMKEPFLLTVLVAAPGMDMPFNREAFIKEWGMALEEQGQKALRKDIFCAFYAIGGETLVPKLGSGKFSACREKRELLRNPADFALKDPRNWVLPIGISRNLSP